ncbi:transcriptional regulator [Phenylobacterium hankyongense]|uniref:Transcriptional regulator n=1 Tax=Phenylobacterium hankyongense TaxID=1813876 RepID=A0A328AYA6_9CAUL|nr:metalloregulator ArsR/SmtB family transcription factor [Phenylobacterium hankyongense]RAK59171.1 transcriptional regulator [Phenylobacterium hankyongense]
MEANVATPAALIGDPVRAAILLALLDGRALPATALAWLAGVSSPAASNHLAKLSGGGLVAVTQQGRHRYYRLAGPEVAHALEALGALSPTPRALDPTLSPKARRLREARTCYDHLAGRIAVALADAFERDGLVEAEGPDRYALTIAGRDRLLALGVDLDGLKAGRRGLARPCLDWTERRRHLAGPLAARLLQRLLELGWIERAREDRAAIVTPAGRRGLREAFGLELDPAAAA